MTDQLDDTEALAAEYVLGTLDEAARRRAEDLLARDAAFARLVDHWPRRLTPVTEAVPPVEPSPEVWRNIEAAIARDRAATTAPQRPTMLAQPTPLLERLGFWRLWAVGASALAAALALYIAAGPVLAPPTPETRFVAVLNEGAATPAWVVTVDLATEQLTIRPVAAVAVADRALELWLLAGAEAPRSLGLLDPLQPASFQVTAIVEAGLPAGTALAVSLEPLGGSPTGLPTGPVVYQGALLPAAD